MMDDPERWGDMSWAWGYAAIKPTPDGKYVALMELIFGVRIVVCEDKTTAGEHWCYTEDVMAGVESFLRFPEPPTGWSRHMLPDGSFEYPEVPDATQS